MNRVATLALTPLSIIYGAATRLRPRLYQKGIFQIHELDAPVISVGNLTTGGTGKSPLVAWVAKQLALRGRRPCILIRGYGRDNPRQRVIVSDGENIADDVNTAGDEPLVLARELKGKAAIVCDADRLAAGNWALANLHSDVFVLDDGFQNLRVTRDLDIVTVDAMAPWGNGKLLPAGSLREPVTALSRADCIVVTRAEDGLQNELRKEIEKVSNARILSSRMVVSGLRGIRDETQSDLSGSKSKPVAAFCAIGNPPAFFQQLRREGHQLCHTMAFRDHHKYTQRDIDRITRKSIAAGAQALITSAKDQVKIQSLRFELPCHVLDIVIQIDDEQTLTDLIEAALKTRAKIN